MVRCELVFVVIPESVIAIDEEDFRECMIDITDTDNMISIIAQLLSVYYFRYWHNGSKLSRYCLGKVRVNQD